MARSLIEERYTWPVRTVLLGGGSLWATSYQILDTDVTVKAIYGHQEGAVLGLQPAQAGASLAHLPYVLHCQSAPGPGRCEVQPGNQSHSKYSAPGLWELLGRIGRPHWPALIRGDRDWGTQANMARCEQEGMPYLFKQRLTIMRW
jgi:hypothetical protein